MSRGVKLSYSEADLRAAVAQSTSWRGVMRTLGYATTNGRTANGIKLEAEALGLDTSHFGHGPKRTWPAKQVEEAVQASASWSEVVGRLGFSSANAEAIARVRGLAARLGIDSRHFTSDRQHIGEMPFTAVPEARHLSRAACSMAMAWFTRRGYAVCIPTEPRPYDLVVEAEGTLYRVQVKTATYRDGRSGQFCVAVSRRPRRDNMQIAYDPADVDFFFIVDGDGVQYLVPLVELGGAKYVTVSTIRHRIAS
jgi:PD-(D/E)XK nuclease superfamily protein